MGVIIGIDGGGTKTRFAAYDLSQNRLVGSIVLEGTDYKQDGFEAVIGRVTRGVSALLEGSQCSGLEAIGFGMPGYSEDPIGDLEMARRLKDVFNEVPCFLVNDVYAAMEGAFYGTAGILAVAGTGSLAYGRNYEGKVDRCGGWSSFFGDEGSGVWIGKQVLEIFSKQSDGRLPKSQIYELTRSYFELGSEDEDFKILERAECNPGNRAATAKLNLLAKQAADQGDAQARNIFNRASEEIAALIYTLRKKLNFEGRTPIAVSGGLFSMEQYITEPVVRILQKKCDVIILKPQLGPCCGAVTLAIEKVRGTETALSIYKIMADDKKCRGL